MARIIIKIFCFPPFLSFSSRKKIVYATFWPQNNNHEKGPFTRSVPTPTVKMLNGQKARARQSWASGPGFIREVLSLGRKPSLGDEKSRIIARKEERWVGSVETRVLSSIWICKSPITHLKSHEENVCVCVFCLQKILFRCLPGTACPSRLFHADLGELASISVLLIPQRSELLFLGTDNYTVIVWMWLSPTGLMYLNSRPLEGGFFEQGTYLIDVAL